MSEENESFSDSLIEYLLIIMVIIVGGIYFFNQKKISLSIVFLTIIGMLILLSIVYLPFDLKRGLLK